MTLYIKQIDPNAKIPLFANGGLNVQVFSSHALTIPKKTHGVVMTGMCLMMSDNKHYYGHITKPAANGPMNYRIGAGIVDEDHFGEVGILVFNEMETDWEIPMHMHIANITYKQIYNENDAVWFRCFFIFNINMHVYIFIYRKKLKLTTTMLMLTMTATTTATATTMKLSTSMTNRSINSNILYQVYPQ